MATAGDSCGARCHPAVCTGYQRACPCASLCAAVERAAEGGLLAQVCASWARQGLLSVRACSVGLRCTSWPVTWLHWLQLGKWCVLLRRNGMYAAACSAPCTVRLSQLNLLGEVACVWPVALAGRRSASCATRVVCECGCWQFV